MKTQITFAALLLSLAGIAQAHGGGSPMRGPDFATLDADGDGYITQAEMKSRAEERFVAADVNGDWMLSVEEMHAQNAERSGENVERMMQHLDANADGRLSEDELPRRGKRKFAAADSDGDGVLTAAELQAQAAERSAEHIERMLERLDANGDGHFGIDEMPGGDAAAHRAELFARADSDGDGMISRDEFEAARESRGAPRGHGKRHGKDRGKHKHD